ncbi:cyclic nucleotide-binding domain-containing protein [Terrarubrum flagellatum]|uniref:cyclic nucleotide-binding domain-containing protein n=1 Tax=Terrirubrum flagellatum TaxID=2895980 RepID=UPI003144D3C8
MSLETDMAALAQVRPFSLLDREALRLIAFSAERRKLRAGDILFRKTAASYGGGVVVSGAIALDPPEDGSPPRHVARRGSLIGGVALLAPTDHAAQSVAQEDSEVLVVPRQLFKRVLDEFPQHAVAIHASLAEDLKKLTRETEAIKRRLDALG